MITTRVWYTKTGEAAYISLLDLQRAVQRAFKRSGLPIWYTLGYNPHSYVTFATPLSLGQESLTESLDCKMVADEMDWEQARADLQKCMPRGVDILRMESVKMDANDIASAQYTVHYESAHGEEAKLAFEKYEQLAVAEVQKNGKKGKVTTLNLKEQIQVISTETDADGFTATLRSPAGGTFNVNPMLLLNFLESEFSLAAAAGSLLRTTLFVKNGEIFI